MKKNIIRFVSTLIVLSFIVATCALALPAAFAADTVDYTVDFNNPAIPANTGETVDLSKIAVEFSDGTPTSNGIAWTSSAITISSNKVTPTAKGVYKLTATWGTNVKNIYLVVKAPSDTEYVLYEDDFSNASTLSNYTFPAGKCSIADGKLTVDALETKWTEVQCLFPDWLGEFGNYSITANATIPSTCENDTSRWTSLLYRAQDSSNYLQMAIRKKATQVDGGVELAKKINGEWSYHGKSNYTSDLSPSTHYTLRLDAFDKKASVHINGTTYIVSNAVTEFSKGKVGFNACGSMASFDDVKVTARFDASGMNVPDSVDVRDINSNITLPASMIYEIKDKTSFNSIMTNSPAVAIMTLDANGNIISSSNQTICSLSDAITKLDFKVIPAFRLASGCTAQNAADMIKNLHLLDVMVVSENANDIKTVRAANTQILGVLDYSNANVASKKATDIRAETLASGAKICILPASKATQKNTDTLNSLGVTVWYNAKENTEIEMFNLVTSGANGIITKDRALTESVLTSSLFKTNTIIRPVSIIGHRGTPALAPDNTVEGSILAAINGANIIENDIYITTDGVLVVSHDNPLKNYTDAGDVKIEDLTYEQVKNIKVTDKPNSPVDDREIINFSVPLPSLEDYFKAFKDTDTFLFIEIKSTQVERVATALKALIEKYDIADQCGVISFSSAALTAVRNQIPEISVGYLYSDKALLNIVNETSKIGSSYNPSYTGLTPELIAELSARGIFAWPWTIDANNKLADGDNLFLMGVGGITTDYSYYTEDYVKWIYTESSEYTLKAGEKISLPVIAENYGADETSDTYENRKYTASRAAMVLLSGNDTLTYTSGKLTATEGGDATVMFRLAYTLNNGKTVYVYTQPVTVHVEASEATEPENTETEATEPENTEDTDVEETDESSTDASDSEGTDKNESEKVTESEKPEESETNKPPKQTSSANDKDDENGKEDNKDDEKGDEDDDEDKDDGGCSAFAPISAISCTITLLGSTVFLKKKKED